MSDISTITASGPDQPSAKKVRVLCWILCFALPLWPILIFEPPTLAAQDDNEQKISQRDLGITISLPDESWKLYDRGQGPVKAYVFSPQSNMRTRCTLLAIPSSLVKDGMATREAPIKSALKDYKRVTLEETELAGRKCEKLEFTAIKTRTMEWGFKDGQYFIIFQISAPEDRWSNAESRASLERIRDSFAYSGHKLDTAVRSVSTLTPDEVRAKRKMANAAPRTFDLSHHEIAVRIDPKNKSLECADVLTVTSLMEKLDSMVLYTSLVKVDKVTGPEGLAWETKPIAENDPNLRSVLTLRFDPPIQKGVEFRLAVNTSSDDYYHWFDQKLVAEVSVLGQVREPSTYSSHIVYYPVDQTNDATANISIAVPKEYTAVSGGELVSKKTLNDWAVFRYENKIRRKRLLPFGFAVARYIQQSGKSDSGLRLTVYGYPGEEQLVEQRVSALVEAANLFEKMMGPLPWQDVHFAHVTPLRKETGISMPGLIVVSDAFFDDISNTDLSDGNLSRRDVLSLLVVADELSHQWNIYAAPLSNELGEGISTFTNLLFAENRHGREAFDRGIKVCVDAYQRSTTVGKDVAIADPAVYTTDAYRGIVFCKTPAILAMLRDEVGDEKFFKAWRRAFGDYDPNRDGFETVEKAFSQVVGKDMSWFFDQWFFQAGQPELEISFSQDEKKVNVKVRQTQNVGAYRLNGKLVLSTDQKKDGATQRIEKPIEIMQRESSFVFEVQSTVTNVELIPGNLLMAKIKHAK